ncbi:hypothetical protein NHQ30_011067 [Ciborinia camelliae]|nr:hypothetical protein NHQ30_011067 [Ciborinia camelliae]
MNSLKNATGISAPEHTDEQKKQFYDNLSDDQKQKQTYTDWVKEAYNEQYEKWMPWIEDQYLKWFGKGDNKASYATKDALSKTKVTGISKIDQIQDDVHNLVGNQLGENGLLAPIGNLAGEEGINRMERNGKDDDGSYGGPTSTFTNPIVQNAKARGQGVVGGAKRAGEGLAAGVMGAGDYVGGMFGAKQREKDGEIDERNRK